MAKTYYYYGETATLHPRMGLLSPGPNEIPDDLMVEAEAAVEAGLLYHEGDSPPAPEMPKSPPDEMHTWDRDKEEPDA